MKLLCLLFFIVFLETYCENFLQESILKEKSIGKYKENSLTIPVVRVDFSKGALFAIWNVTTTSIAEFYLVNEQNFKKLKYKEPFFSFWSLKNSTVGAWEADISKIHEKLIVCVVNRNPFPIHATFNMKQNISLFQISLLKIMFRIFLIIGCLFICCLCNALLN